MELKELSLNDCEQVRIWRNQIPEMLRTPFLLTKEMQERFYHEVICDRNARARFWGIRHEKPTQGNMEITPIGTVNCTFISNQLIGMAGLENISWENRLAEISLILNPAVSTPENMTMALDLLLEKAFNGLNLNNVYTEVYGCNPYLEFWVSVFRKYHGKEQDIPMLPYRKYYNGLWFSSFYININKERYNENIIS